MLKMHRDDRSVAGSALFALAVLAAAVAAVVVSVDAAESTLDRHAVEYVDLVAALGGHSPESIDFQTLPRQPGVRLRRLADIGARSRALANHIRQAHMRDSIAVDEAARGNSLAAQLESIESRVDQLTGRLTFDAELQRLYGIERPTQTEPHHADTRAELAKLLPGDEPLSLRLAKYQRRFAVPRGRLHDAVTRSIALCRERTVRYLPLPEGESLDIQYVADKPWSGYSVYRGGYRSVMQVNRTFPLSASDVLTLACHEGYPGHHVYNTLREQHIVRGRGRTEGTALLLFSPEGFRAESVVSAAASMAFSQEERSRAFREHLFPLLDIDPGEAERYVEVCRLVDRLTAAATPVLLQYLAGELDRDRAADALRAVALMEQPQGVLDYVDRFRGYSLAYTVGRDHFTLASTGSPDQQWAYLRRLILQYP